MLVIRSLEELKVHIAIKLKEVESRQMRLADTKFKVKGHYHIKGEIYAYEECLKAIEALLTYNHEEEG